MVLGGGGPETAGTVLTQPWFAGSLGTSWSYVGPSRLKPASLRITAKPSGVPN